MFKKMKIANLILNGAHNFYGTMKLSKVPGSLYRKVK